jgi:hypothetical protein
VVLEHRLVVVVPCSVVYLGLPRAESVVPFTPCRRGVACSLFSCSQCLPIVLRALELPSSMSYARWNDVCCGGFPRRERATQQARLPGVRSRARPNWEVQASATTVSIYEEGELILNATACA